MMGEENNDVETSSESYDDSETECSERKPRSKERGPDKKPRTYRANSMSNLTQFNKRPEEFSQYLNDVKGVDITGNSGVAKTFLIFGGIMIAVFGGLWLYNRYKNERNDNVENTY